MESFMAWLDWKVLAMFAVFFCIGVVMRRRAKKKAEAEDVPGPELPPMLFTGNIHPKSLPDGFGRTIHKNVSQQQQE